MQIRWQISALRLPAILATALALSAAPPRAAAQSSNGAAIASVRAKLEGAAYARQTLGVIHLGCKSNGATVLNVTTVTGPDGQILPGKFATVVRYHWTDLAGNQGSSDMTYFFDEQGRYLAFRTGRTTARFLKHFAEAKLAAAALAELVLSDVQDPQRRDQMRDLINQARVEDVFHLKMALEFP